MSTAHLFVEAVDTALALADTVWQWLIVLATVAAILLLAVCACCAWAVDAAWEWLCARLRPEHAPQAPESTQAHKRRPTPSWAHEQPIDCEEAA